jgi:hypothetical protein
MSAGPSQDEAQSIAEDPLLVQQLWLIKNGIPFDIAMSIDVAEGKAWAVIFGQFEGGEYDWAANRWKDRT